MTDDLLQRIETYYDLAPRATAHTELHRSLHALRRRHRLALLRTSRPSATARHLPSRTLRTVLDRQRELAIPAAFEWIDDVSPDLLPPIEAAGLHVHRCPLMVLENHSRELVPDVDGVDVARSSTPTEAESRRCHPGGDRHGLRRRWRRRRGRSGAGVVLGRHCPRPHAGRSARPGRRRRPQHRRGARRRCARPPPRGRRERARRHRRASDCPSTRQSAWPSRSSSPTMPALAVSIPSSCPPTPTTLPGSTHVPDSCGEAPPASPSRPAEGRSVLPLAPHPFASYVSLTTPEALLSLVGVPTRRAPLRARRAGRRPSMTTESIRSSLTRRIWSHHHRAERDQSRFRRCRRGTPSASRLGVVPFGRAGIRVTPFAFGSAAIGRPDVRRRCHRHPDRGSRRRRHLRRHRTDVRRRSCRTTRRQRARRSCARQLRPVQQGRAAGTTRPPRQCRHRARLDL